MSNQNSATAQSTDNMIIKGTIHSPAIASVREDAASTTKSLRKYRVQALAILLSVVGALFFHLITSQAGQELLSRFVSTHFKPYPSCHPTSKKNFTFTRLGQILQSVPSVTKLEEWSRYYTSQPHFAGQGRDQGLWTKQKWDNFGIPKTQIVSYNIFVGNPVSQQLALFEQFEDIGREPKLLYEAALMEDMPQDDSSELRTPAYHGGSFSGTVTAQYVYANFGLTEDFDDLEKAKVDLNGKIAIVKYGGVFRGEKMYVAARRGIAGIVLYTDPQQDGNLTEGHGFNPYPDGPARPSTYIERGAIDHFMATSSGPNPSIDGESIPSLPCSYNDIVPILKALKGSGPKAETLGKRWLGGGLSYNEVEYHVGPSPSRIVLKLDNQMDYVSKPIYDVFGIIKGSTMEDEVVILGNHRDAWTAGAGDPNSGSAALMEVVRSFSTAFKAGWRPERTVMFVSWEGEELGQAGSEPWIIDNLAWLSGTAVAYINVVVAGAGRRFHAKATPILRRIVHDVTNTIPSPDRSAKGQTILDQWGGKIWTPGGGDAIQFLQKACVSTLDFGFSPGPEDPTFPYHSNFDTFAWINTTGDPGWIHHLATTRVWSMMAAHLVESPVLKFNATDYAIALKGYVQFAKETLPQPMAFDLSPLEHALDGFHSACILFDSYASFTASLLQETSANTYEYVLEHVRQINRKYMRIERQFCFQENPSGSLNDSEHVLFQESPWYQNPPALPHLLESFESKNWSKAEVSSLRSPPSKYGELGEDDIDQLQKWRDVIQSKVKDATAVLEL